MKKIELTTEEKLRLICGVSSWYTADFDGKLPRIKMSDGPIGLRTVVEREGVNETLPATAYPAIQTLANTWDAGLSRRMGECLADDATERDVDILLAPGVNIKRSPFCGRNFEYFSEDPLVAGVLAREYIEGVQGKGISVCLKHFMANNLEYDRFHQTSDVDERTMREIYYKPFEIACAAKPLSVMCSYNRVNGVYAAENAKGFKVLREEFGFDGAIISDWNAVRDRTASAKAGLDLEMPFNEENYQKLVADYKAGKLSDEELDACADRMLTFIYRLAEARKTRKLTTTVEERRGVAKRIAAEGAVLLKNNGVLPLKKNATISICGTYVRDGSYGTRDFTSGGGSARVKWLDPSFDLSEKLEKLLGGKVLRERGFHIRKINSQHNTVTAAMNAARSDVNIVCACTGSYFEYESGDKQTLRLNNVQERAILETAARNPNTVVVIFAGSAVDTSVWEDKVAAILYAGFVGMGGDEALAEILAGEVNPCGKLTETFAREQDLPDFHVGLGVTRYQEGLDVGYRYYDTHGVPVLYPFGYGLSYSTFEYGNLKLRVKGDILEVRYELENASLWDGKEVSQVYVRECCPLVYRPFKELKGFSKDEVRAGRKKSVSVQLDRSAFAYWSTARDAWTVEDGVFEILVGSSAEDIRLSAKIEIKEGKILLL